MYGLVTSHLLLCNQPDHRQLSTPFVRFYAPYGSNVHAQPAWASCGAREGLVVVRSRLQDVQGCTSTRQSEARMSCSPPTRMPVVLARMFLQGNMRVARPVKQTDDNSMTPAVLRRNYPSTVNPDDCLSRETPRLATVNLDSYGERGHTPAFCTFPTPLHLTFLRCQAAHMARTSIMKVSDVT